MPIRSRVYCVSSSTWISKQIISHHCINFTPLTGEKREKFSMISKVSKVEVGFLSRFDFDDYILDYISFPFPENTNVLNEEVGLSGKSV